MVMGITACGPWAVCSSHELGAPDIMACAMHGQTGIADWLRRFDTAGHSIRDGWKSFVNRRGEEREA